jgi:hypothetical protein
MPPFAHKVNGRVCMEKILELMEIVSRPNYNSDYSSAKAANTCIRCRRSAKKFRDGCSRLEYSVSALCQACQDEIFKKTMGDSAS